MEHAAGAGRARWGARRSFTVRLAIWSHVRASPAPAPFGGSGPDPSIRAGRTARSVRVGRDDLCGYREPASGRRAMIADRASGNRHRDRLVGGGGR